jgi:hypothetical protein
MKTKITLTALLLVLTHFLFASAWEEDGKFKRIYIGLSVTPNVTYRYLKQGVVPAGLSSSEVQDVITSRNKYEYPGVGIGGAVKLGVRLTHFLSIESGVQVTYQWYRYSSVISAYPPGWTPMPIPTDSFVSKEKNKYVYFNIPLALNFTVGKHRVKGIISLGTTFDFLLRQNINYTYTYNNGTTSSTRTVSQYDNFKTFNLSPFLGIGIDCYLSKALVLRIMPIAQIQAFQNINTPITEYLYNAGINVSLLLGF